MSLVVRQTAVDVSGLFTPPTSPRVFPLPVYPLYLFRVFTYVACCLLLSDRKLKQPKWGEQGCKLEYFIYFEGITLKNNSVTSTTTTAKWRRERDSTNTGCTYKRLGNEETVRDDRLQSRRWTRYTGGAGAPTPAMVSKRLHQRHTNNLSHDALSARLLLLVWCLCCVQKSDYVLTAANGGLPETLSSLSHMMSRVYDAATCMSRGGSQCHMGDFIGDKPRKCHWCHRTLQCRVWNTLVTWGYISDVSLRLRSSLPPPSARQMTGRPVAQC